MHIIHSEIKADFNSILALTNYDIQIYLVEIVSVVFESKFSYKALLFWCCTPTLSLYLTVRQ